MVAFDAPPHPGRRPGGRLLAASVAAALFVTGCSTTFAGMPQVDGGGAVPTGTTPTGGSGGSVGGGGDGTQQHTVAPGPVVDRGTVEPYVVKGRVTTAAGRPLPGAEVWADNTLAYNSNALAVSGADGSYRIELPRSEVLTWRMGGHIVTTYQGQQFDLDLAVDGTPFASSAGAVRDFVWKLAGPHADDADLYYGGLVYVYEDLNHNELGDGAWQITFTPNGPLIDGSTGQAFTRDADRGEIADVPVGRYTVTAVYRPNGGGAAVPLHIRQRDTGDYAPGATAGFREDSVPTMELEIVKP